MRRTELVSRDLSEGFMEWIWASLVGACQGHKPQHPHHVKVSPRRPIKQRLTNSACRSPQRLVMGGHHDTHRPLTMSSPVFITFCLTANYRKQDIYATMVSRTSMHTSDRLADVLLETPWGQAEEAALAANNTPDRNTEPEAWMFSSALASSRRWPTPRFIKVEEVPMTTPGPVWTHPIFSVSGLHHHHHHLSLSREGRWGTTDDFTTSFLHFSLLSTALWDLVNSAFLVLSTIYLFMKVSFAFWYNPQWKTGLKTSIN